MRTSNFAMLAIVTALCGALTACGSSKTDSDSMGGGGAASSAYEGAWLQPCDDDDTKLASFNGVMTFTGAKVVFTNRYFKDTGCDDDALLMEQTQSGSFTLGAAPEEGEPRPVDTLLDTTTVTLVNKTLAKDAKAEKSCGIGDWTAGKAKAVDGKECEFPLNLGDDKTKIKSRTMIFDEAGTKNYNLLLRKGDKLWPGKSTEDLDGSSARKRPKRANEDVTYKKKK